MLNLDLPETALLDGGMGRELRFRGVKILDTIWSANGLLVAPEIVRQIHIDGHKQTDGSLELRSDLDPDTYAKHVADWLSAGATVIGGCCGTRPAHIARLREMLDETETLK